MNTRHLRFIALATLTVLLAAASFRAAAVDAVLTGDAYVSAASPGSNFGTARTLSVANGVRSFVKFDLATLPSGTTGSKVAKATLTMWVNRVVTAGNIDLAEVGSAWNEATVNSSTAPATSSAFASQRVAAASQFVVFDVTAQVKRWIDGRSANHGLAISAATPAAVLLDSKENTATSHSPRLEITLIEALAGDVTGPASATVVGRIQSQSVLATPPTEGHALIFRGGQWQPASDVANMSILLTQLQQQIVRFFPSGRAYVANSLSDSVSVIDTPTNNVIATVPVGSDPFGVAINTAGTRVYVTNIKSNNVSVIDAASNTVVATFSVGSAPYFIAVNRTGTRAYVANALSNSVTVIDAATNTVIATVAVGLNPFGLVINSAGTRVFVANTRSNSISVIDTATETVVATVGTALPAPSVVAIHPSGDRVYVGHYPGDSGITVIDTTTNAVTAVIGAPSPNSTLGIAVHPSGTRVYASGVGGGVHVIDTTTNTLVGRIAVGNRPLGIAVTR